MQDSITAETISEPQLAQTENQPSVRFRIWAVSEYYHPNFSGAAIQAHRILGALADRGHEVRVLTIADQAAKTLAGKQARIDGLKVSYLPALRRAKWNWLPFGQSAVRSINELFRRASFDLRVLWQLIRHGKKGDVVQFYVVGELTRLVIAYASLRGMRTVIQISLCGADDPSSIQATYLGLSSQMTRSCFYATDCVIGLSSALTQSCHEFGLPEGKVKRIPNGVDLSHFRHIAEQDRDRLCERLDLDPDGRYVVFVGSAIHRKGIDVVIPAFMDLAEQHVEAQLLIVGPCDFSDQTRHPVDRKVLVDRLRSQLAEHGMADRVHWVGEVDDVQDYLRVADVFFFPTRREGLPNALAEAMASQLPVVVSHIEGVTTDLVTSGVHGILVNGYDAQDYTAALRELFLDDEKRELMSRASRQRIEREFELSRIAGRYEELYNLLISETSTI